MFHLVFLILLGSAIAEAQSFRLDVPPEEAAPTLSLSTHQVVPTMAGVEADMLALEARQDLTEEEREREREKLRRDYDIAVLMLELEKARESRQREAEKQGQEFTRLYLQLDMADEDFPEKFRELEMRFPLAIEEPLSRKLIEKARRFIARQMGWQNSENGAATGP